MSKRTKTDPFVLQVRRRQRESIIRETERSRQAASKAARDAIYRTIRTDRVTDEKIHNAVVFATSRLGLAVLNSMDINVPFSASVSYQGTKAMTDFQSIKIVVDPRAYDLNDIDAVARLIQFTKGLIYHEAGHILYSVPFRKLVELSGYTPATLDELAVRTQVSTSELMQAWNCLEDQRMECAMVRASAIMRTYFSVIVQDFVTRLNTATGWAWVAGRTYLPKEVLVNFRDAGRDYSSTYDSSLVADTSACISQYKRASTPEDMFNAVREYALILRRWRDGGVSVGEGLDRHETYPINSGDIPVNDIPVNWGKRIEQTASDEQPPTNETPDEPKPPTKGNGEDKEGSEDGKGGATDESDGESDGESDESDESDGDSDGDGEESADDSDPTTGDTKGKGNDDDGGDTPPDDPTPQPSSDQDKPGMSNDGSVGEGRDSSESNTGDSQPDSIDEQARQVAKDFLGTVNDEIGRSLPHNVDVKSMQIDDISKANEVYNGMMRALEPLAVQVDPAWRFGQDTGILDPTGYHLREPGDFNYWINLDDIGSQGFDLAVSVIIDVSYSMEYMVRDVGIAALGIRKACDALGIPCTVSTFSGHSHVLWEADDDVTDVYPLATGATNPDGALDALPDQRLGKTRHLVIILTDGIWSDDISLASYNEPGRYFMMAGIGVQVRQMERLGPDSAISINGPLQLPELATNVLSGYLA